jgi:hypothetical protein
MTLLAAALNPKFAAIPAFTPAPGFAPPPVPPIYRTVELETGIHPRLVARFIDHLCRVYPERAKNRWEDA